ncbi:MAG: glycosyltransferase [Desulfovibrionales bacterium]
MVGSNYKIKGVDRAIKAVSSLPSSLREKSCLIVVGKGDKKPYQRLAKRLKVSSQVLFLGQRDDVPKFLFGADLLLHPAYHENTGTVIIEAMAAGLPVLATDTCGYSFHVIRADAGKVIPSPFNQERMNQMLSSMLSSDNKKKWQTNAKAYIEKLDIGQMHKKITEIIEKVAEDKQSFS